MKETQIHAFVRDLPTSDDTWDSIPLGSVKKEMEVCACTPQKDIAPAKGYHVEDKGGCSAMPKEVVGTRLSRPHAIPHNKQDTTLVCAALSGKEKIQISMKALSRS
jgi:hypothetical protein